MITVLGFAATLAFGHDAASFVFGKGDQVPPENIAALKRQNRVRRISPAEAGVIQSFRKDYPWSGGIGSQLTQVGNCVPVLLAKAIVDHLIEK